MRISHTLRIVYFSIPKTGSETIRNLLDPVSDEEIVRFPEINEKAPFYSHMRPCAARNTFNHKGWDFNDYHRFATVRNPWARLASLYKMTCRNWGQQWNISFSKWIEALDPSGHSTADMPEKWYAHGTMSMVKFLSDQNGNLLVNRVFRIEDQAEALYTDICARVGLVRIQHGLGHKNRASRPYDWRAMYSLADRRIISDLYADDIEHFGYSYE
jgi:hypothetical protein